MSPFSIVKAFSVSNWWWCRFHIYNIFHEISMPSQKVSVVSFWERKYEMYWNIYIAFLKKKKTDQISDRLCCLSFTLELQPQPAGNFADLRGLDYSAWESSPSTRAEDVHRSQSILIDPGFFFFFNKSYITVNVFALQWFCKLQWQIACSID